MQELAKIFCTAKVVARTLPHLFLVPCAGGRCRFDYRYVGEGTIYLLLVIVQLYEVVGIVGAFVCRPLPALPYLPHLFLRTKQHVPFQVFNMFRKDGPYRDNIEKLVRSPRLAHIAAQLLGCER